MKAYVHTYTWMWLFLVALFTMPKIKINPNVHQKQRDKLWYLYTKEYYTAVKERNKLLIDTKTWVNLKISRQNERSQTKMNSHYIIAFILNFRQCKLTYSHKKWTTSCLGPGAEGRICIKRAGWNLMRVEIFCIWLLWWFHRFYTYLKTYQIVYPKRMQYVICTFITPQWNWYPLPKEVHSSVYNLLQE